MRPYAWSPEKCARRDGREIRASGKYGARRLTLTDEAYQLGNLFCSREERGFQVSRALRVAHGGADQTFRDAESARGITRDPCDRARFSVRQEWRDHGAEAVSECEDASPRSPIALQDEAQPGAVPVELRFKIHAIGRRALAVANAAPFDPDAGVAGSRQRAEQRGHGVFGRQRIFLRPPMRAGQKVDDGEAARREPAPSAALMRASVWHHRNRTEPMRPDVHLAELDARAGQSARMGGARNTWAGVLLQGKGHHLRGERNRLPFANRVDDQRVSGSKRSEQMPQLEDVRNRIVIQVGEHVPGA